MLVRQLYIFIGGMSVQSLASFLIRLFSHWWVLWVSGIFWITVHCQICLWEIFSPSLWLVSSFTWHWVSQSRSFSCRWSLASQLFHGSYLWCYSSVAITTKSSRFLLCCTNFIGFYFALRSVLNFVQSVTFVSRFFSWWGRLAMNVQLFQYYWMKGSC